MDNSIGLKIRKIRELKGYSQEYMASKLDMTQRSYSNLERNEVELSWNRLQAIADVLEMKPTDLINFSDQLFFENCKQSGKIQNINNFPDKLMEQYEARIAHLEKEIAFLRGALSKK